jgi:hypothetical protein
MKKMMILILMTMLIPMTSMAMQEMESKNGAMKMEQGSMGMEGVLLLQEEVVDGVKAAAHLMDGKDGMGKMLMLMFTDEKSGAMISSGRVAVKVVSPDEKVGDAQMMMKSKGMFGAAVQFEQKGIYHFNVGTKLEDGVKRSFKFYHEAK